MAEHWSYDFFKLSEPRERQTGDVILSTTTDTQNDLDRAASEVHEPQTEPTITYVEMGRSIENPDGSIEHSAPTVRTNAPPEPHLADSEPYYLERLTPEQRYQNTLNYIATAHAARIHYGEQRWLEALGENVEIPTMARAMIAEGGLPNGAELALFLGENRQHADELMALRKEPKRVQERILELSAQLASGQLGLNSAPYRAFQKIRESQIGGRR